MKDSKESPQMDRRKFLKTLGIGSLGLGALAAVPGASALDIQTNELINSGENLSLKSDKLNFYGSGSNTPDFRIDENGNTVIQGNLDVQQNEIKQLVIDQKSSDPNSPAVGQIWYRTDLD